MSDLDEVDQERADATEAVIAAAVLAILLQSDPAGGSPPSILGTPDWGGMVSDRLAGALRQYLTSTTAAFLESTGMSRFEAAEITPRIVARAMPDAVESLAEGVSHLYSTGRSIAQGTQGLTRASAPADTAADRSSDAYRRIRIGSAALARNRTTAIREALRYQLASAAGATHATWRTRKDARVRPTHGGLEGDTNPIDKPWTTFEGHPLRYPGDPLAPPDEVQNCRCRLSYRLPEGAAIDPGALVGPALPPHRPDHLWTEYEGAAPVRPAGPLDAGAMVLATARLARLVADDRIAAGLRDRVQARFGATHPATYLVNCPVCVSVWAGAAVATVLPARLVWALALSEAAIAARLED